MVLLVERREHLPVDAQAALRALGSEQLLEVGLAVLQTDMNDESTEKGRRDERGPSAPFRARPTRCPTRHGPGPGLGPARTRISATRPTVTDREVVVFSELVSSERLLAVGAHKVLRVPALVQSGHVGTLDDLAARAALRIERLMRDRKAWGKRGGEKKK